MIIVLSVNMSYRYLSVSLAKVLRGPAVCPFWGCFPEFDLRSSILLSHPRGLYTNFPTHAADQALFPAAQRSQEPGTPERRSARPASSTSIRPASSAPVMASLVSILGAGLSCCNNGRDASQLLAVS